MSRKYGLSFISDQNLYQHVMDTVKKYRFQVDLKQFTKNIIDPIKLSFDTEIYGKPIKEIIEAEVIRQIDKSNTNHIGYFHQNIFRYFDGWEVPVKGFDVINEELNIFVEVKNKHNTMNSSASQKTYMKMQNTILRNDKATCYLAEVIAKDSQDIVWSNSLDGEKISNNKIRRISIDKLYKMATGTDNAFKELCKVLPIVLVDVVDELQMGVIENTVFDELNNISTDITKSLYLLSFGKYEGFDDF